LTLFIPTCASLQLIREFLAQLIFNKSLLLTTNLMIATLVFTTQCTK